MLKNILWVMLGGSVGAALRYLVGILCNRWHWTALPWGTFIVNVVGCFLLGLFMGLGEKYTHLNAGVYLLLTAGLCGAFTTFSTFMADTYRLMDSGQLFVAIGYLCASFVAGFLLFYVGRAFMSN